MKEWNPGLYLKFQKERTQPVRDLIARIDMRHPERILDIGCGPGNSSKELKDRWWNAEVLGLDSSGNMIKKAMSENSRINYVLADATEDTSRFGMFDIIFSNAAMQWMPEINRLLPDYFKMLNPGGIMAMQIPNPSDMPIHNTVKDVAESDCWKGAFDNFSDGLHLFEPGYYYDILAGLGGELHLWETHYHHVMPGHHSIVDWYSSTGMKPYLDNLSEASQSVFKEMVLELVKSGYPVNSDKTVLFPFRRIFFTLRK